MPIYEFDCSECGHGFERLQRLADPDPEQCPGCGKTSVRRRLSAPSFRLAGSGWYETDFKGDKDKRRNLAGKDDGGAAPAAADAAAGKTDAAPDAASAKTADKPAAAAPASNGVASA